MLTNKYTVDKNKVAYKIIDNEIIILNLDNGNYYSLNDSAAVIWKSIASGNSLGKTVSLMNKLFLTKEQLLASDTLSLAKKLEKLGLIKKI